MASSNVDFDGDGTRGDCEAALQLGLQEEMDRG